MQRTEPAGKLLVVREPARCRLRPPSAPPSTTDHLRAAGTPLSRGIPHMRFWLITSMVVPAATVVAAKVVLFFPLRNFRRSRPVLRDESDMTAFKRLASTQMYASYVMFKLT